MFCLLFCCLEALLLAAQGAEVALAVTRDGACASSELGPLGLIRVDVLAAALCVELAASLPDAVDAEACRERGLDVRELALDEALRADHYCGLLGVTALAQHLLQQHALAVADDGGGLNDLGLGSRARHRRGSLARLGALEQVVHAALVGVHARQLGLLLIQPDVPPQALAVIGGQLWKEQYRRRVNRCPRAAAAAPVAVAVQRIGGVAVPRAHALLAAAQEPLTIHRVIDAKRHF